MLKESKNLLMNQELFFSPICGRQNNNLSKMSTNLMLQIHECVT